MRVYGLGGGLTAENEKMATFVGNNLVNVFTGGADDDTISGLGGNDVLNGAGGNDFISGGDDNDTITGGAGNDTLEGDGGDDFILSDEGSDTIDGGAGNDSVFIFWGTTADTITITDSGGIDTLDFTGALGSVYADLFNLATSAAGARQVTFAVGTTFENLIGGGFNDVLFGNSADNDIDGAGGDDEMAGFLGDDTYRVDSIDDYPYENLGEGYDTVIASTSYALADTSEIEALILSGTGNFSATGNSLDNAITGNSGHNILDGGLGDDTMTGGSGDDDYFVDSHLDVVVEGANGGDDIVGTTVSYTLADNVEEGVMLTSADISLTGNDLNNVLLGGSGDNALDGLAGEDTMSGGNGNDTYTVDNADDVVIEQTDQGRDLVLSSVSYTLAANVEQLTLTGTSAINGTGNTLNNHITGNSAFNVLDGGDGNDTLNGGENGDTMIGGRGDDTYYVDNAADFVFENANQGDDFVLASIDYTLPSHVEGMLMQIGSRIGTGNARPNVIQGNLEDNTISGLDGRDTLYGYEGDDTLDGGAGNDTLYGGENDDTLIGGRGADYLDGGTGDDTMTGGRGNDIFIVDNILDFASELANQGVDHVLSSVNFTLAANVENLTLTGDGDIIGTGNSLNNVIIGNSGNNQISGGAGGDEMRGGAGSDRYTVDNGNDFVIENADEGNDRVFSSLINITLSANVEEAQLQGVLNLNATGNGLDNYLFGNTGNNRLDGRGGADTMQGSQGNDILVVDNAGDEALEFSGEGTDTVEASISYTMENNIENLVLTGSAAINGTGNELANTITGNSGANILTGGLGRDTMTGAAGADTFAFTNTSSGRDTITDFSIVDDLLSISAAGFGGGLIEGGAVILRANSAPVAIGAGGQFLYDTDDGRLFYDADGAGGAASVRFATLTNLAAITAADFVVVG